MKLGIDIDTWKLTLCNLGEDRVEWQTATIRRSKTTLFTAIQNVAPALSLAVSRLSEPPSEVWIERGRGQHRKGEYELGAIFGATSIAIRRSLPNVYVQPMQVGWWKKAVTAAVGIETARGVPGNGNATKEVANSACLEILQGLGLGHGGLSADELDAFGIAWTASQ